MGAAALDAPTRGQGVTSVPRVELRGVTKHFQAPDGSVYPAIEDVDLTVPAGSFVAIVGPSGCGKSTLLRLIAGLAAPTAGEIRLDGVPVRGVQHERIGFLFQQDALLPWRTVFDNVALGLKIRGVTRREIRERVEYWLAKVGLSGFARHYPAQLSGGMRKRVAIAQTLITDPQLILMDEPFTALDAQTRHVMETDLAQLFGEGDRTIVLVTHDLDEAVALADTVVVMTRGPRSRIKAIEDVGLPRPRDLLAARRAPRAVELTTYLWQLLYEEVGDLGRAGGPDRPALDGRAVTVGAPQRSIHGY
mgnify:CR=1 FL=1